jgi:cyclopropane fatty-acyl-phospholipid synthase-like methyltransferase
MFNGRWDEIGQKMMKVCIENGLQPDMKLLDVGCGPLRVGTKLINYLNKGNYYGIDSNENYLNIGINEVLIDDNLTEKTSIENFTITSTFNNEHFNTCFDMILVSGVFTHLTLNHFIFFMEKIKNTTKLGSKILATFFICDEDHDITKPIEIINRVNNEKLTLSHISDPYFYKISQIKKMVDKDLWEISIFNEENFKQSLLVFERKQ